MTRTFVTVIALIILGAQSVAASLPIVAEPVDLECQVAGITVEASAVDNDGDLISMVISIYAYPTEADALNGTNGMGHSDRIFSFAPTNAMTKSAAFDCVPNRYYRAVVRAGDDDDHFDIGQSDGVCPCAAVSSPTLNEWGLILLVTSLLGLGAWILRRRGLRPAV